MGSKKNKKWKQTMRERGASESLEVLIDRKAREESVAKAKAEAEAKAKAEAKVRAEAEAKAKAEAEAKAKVVSETRRQSFLERIQKNEQVSQKISESVKKKSAMRDIRLKNEIAEETRKNAYAIAVQKKIEEAEGEEER